MLIFKVCDLQLSSVISAYSYSKLSVVVVVF